MTAPVEPVPRRDDRNRRRALTRADYGPEYAAHMEANQWRWTQHVRDAWPVPNTVMQLIHWRSRLWELKGQSSPIP